jgi:hypothetical protein
VALHRPAKSAALVRLFTLWLLPVSAPSPPRPTAARRSVKVALAFSLAQCDSIAQGKSAKFSGTKKVKVLKCGARAKRLGANRKFASSSRLAVVGSPSLPGPRIPSRPRSSSRTRDKVIGHSPVSRFKLVSAFYLSSAAVARNV